MGRRRAGVAALVVLGALGAPSLAETPTDDGGPSADCRVVAGSDTLEVVCDVDGLSPDEDVVLRVTGTVAAEPASWVGGGAAGQDGAVQARVAVPCGEVSDGRVEVVGTAADGGRFRHQEPVDLTAGCVTGTQRLLWGSIAGVAVVGVAGALLWRWRRRRVTRGRRAGRAAPRRRGAGRRRSRGRRSRRR